MPISLEQLRISADSSAPTQAVLDAANELQTGIQAFRERMAANMPAPAVCSENPDWVYAQANLAVAELIFWTERASYQPSTYQHAVNAARRMVELVRGLNYKIYASLRKLCYLLSSVATLT